MNLRIVGRAVALASFVAFSLPVAHAAEDAASKIALATKLERGIGMPRSYARALTLYCEAAQQGSADGAWGAAWMYFHGVGMRKNTPNGIAWLRVAASRGHDPIPHARRALAR